MGVGVGREGIRLMELNICGKQQNYKWQPSSYELQKKSNFFLSETIKQQKLYYFSMLYNQQSYLEAFHTMYISECVEITFISAV